jgi:hypothetical protein
MKNIALLLLIAASARAFSQSPADLPAITITAAPQPGLVTFRKRPPAPKAAGLDSLENQPASPPGLPDMTRPIHLSVNSLVCIDSSNIVGMSRNFRTPPADPQIVRAMRANGCTFSDREVRVVISLPDADSDEHQTQTIFHYAGIVWRNSSGQVWSGYTMIDNLHN